MSAFAPKDLFQAKLPFVFHVLAALISQEMMVQVIQYALLAALVHQMACRGLHHQRHVRHDPRILWLQETVLHSVSLAQEVQSQGLNFN